MQTDLAKGLQYLGSGIQSPDVPQVKQHLINVAQKMSQISDDVQNRQIGTIKAAHADFFKRRPEIVNGIIQSIQGAAPPMPGQGNASPQQNLPHGGKYAPGSSVTIGKTSYIVGDDGDTLKEIK